MSELTEREQKLVEMLKTLIKVTTVMGIYHDQTIKLLNWKYDAMQEIGFGLEFQDNLLKTLESEFGVRYTKLDPETHQPLEETKEDGNKS